MDTNFNKNITISIQICLNTIFYVLGAYHLLKKTVGVNIRSIRKIKGFSQNEAALRAGFTPSYWGYLERGQKNPSLELIEKVAAVLGVEPITLLVDPSSGGMHSETLQLLNIISGMGDMSRRFIYDVMSSYIKTHG